MIPDDPDVHPSMQPDDLDANEPIVFHYNRRRRLENGPQDVRHVYDQPLVPQSGFLRVLVANRALKSIFFSIIIMSVVIGVVTLVTGPPDRVLLNDIPFELNAFLFEETVYVTLTAGSDTTLKPEFPLLVEAVLTATDRTGTDLDHRDLMTVWNGGEQAMRTTFVDHELIKITAQVKIDKNEAMMYVLIER